MLGNKASTLNNSNRHSSGDVNSTSFSLLMRSSLFLIDFTVGSPPSCLNLPRFHLAIFWADAFVAAIIAHHSLVNGS